MIMFKSFLRHCCFCGAYTGAMMVFFVLLHWLINSGLVAFEAVALILILAFLVFFVAGCILVFLEQLRPASEEVPDSETE